MTDAGDLLQLYHFKYFDPVRKRWIRARYVATLEEIAARHERFETIGEPELRRRGDPNDLGHST